MRIVTYILIFFIAVSMLVMCKVTKPLIPVKNLTQDSIVKPTVKIESMTIDKPVTITIPGKDTTGKLEITVTTPKTIIVPVFDTVNINKWVETYFHDLKETISNNEGINNAERQMLVNRIRGLLKEKDALKDTISELKVKYMKAEKTNDVAESAVYDIPIFFGLSMLGFCVLVFLLYRCVKHIHKKKHFNHYTPT